MTQDKREDLANELTDEQLQVVSAGTPSKPTKSSTFEIKDYSFGVEQTLTIGSQSSGAGAGKVTFNPF